MFYIRYMRKPDHIERLYIDFDSYFASVEQQLNPAWAGRPVGVLPLDSPHSALIATSYEAKALGVTRGTRAREARDIIPDIVLTVARHDVYVRMHHAIIAAIEQHLPVHKVWSVDEMECVLMGRERFQGPDIARRIKQTLAEEVGPNISGSIGLGPNQMLAKVAAEMDKPDGLTVLHPEDLPGRLFEAKISDFPGIGPRMQVRLARAGVLDVKTLWGLQAKQMRKLWGSVEGERLWAGLHGYDVERPETTKSMFGHSRILTKGWRNPEKALACARLLTVKAARRMRREGYAARTFHVGVKSDGQRWGADYNFAVPVSDDHTFLEQLEHLLARAFAETGDSRPASVSVFMSSIVPLGHAMGDLLEPEADKQARAKWEKVSRVIDDLNARHKSDVLSMGPAIELPGGYAGAKIAFGRVPDAADFY